MLYLCKITLQFLKRNKIRTLMTFVSITLCVTLVSCLSNELISNYYAPQSFAEASHGTWLFKYAADNEDEMNELLNQVEVKQTATESLMGIAEVNDHYQVELYHYSNFELNPHYLTEGRLPQNEQEIVISKYYQKRTQHNIGDRIEMEFSNNDQETFVKIFKITGVAVFSSSMQGNVVVDKVLSQSDETSNMMTTFVATEQMSEEKFLSIQSFFQTQMMNESVDGSMFNATLNDDVICRTYYNKAFDFPVSQHTISLIIIILLLLVVLYATLTGMFRMTFKEREKFFGVIASVGGTSKQLHIIASMEVLLYSILCIPLGLFLGYYGLKALYGYTIVQYFKEETNGIPMELCTSSILNIGLSILFVALLLLIANRTIQRISKKMTIDLLKTYQSVNVKTNAKSCFTSKDVSSSLGKRYRKFNKRKYGSLVFMLVLCIVFFCVSSYYYDYSNQSRQMKYNDHTLHVSLAPMNTYQEIINMDQKLDQIIQKNTQNNNYVFTEMTLSNARSFPMEMFSDEYVQAFGYPETYDISISLIGVDESLYEKQGFDKDTVLVVNEKKVINEFKQTKTIPIFKQEEDFNYSHLTRSLIGDQWYEDEVTIQIPVKENSITNEKWNAINQSSMYQSDSELLNIKLLYSYENLLTLVSKFENENHLNMQMRIEMESDDVTKLRTQIEKDEEAMQFIYSIQDASQEETKGINQYLAEIISGCVLIISAFNLINIMLANVFERKRDYAILESIGLSDRQMRKIVYRENIILITIVLLIAIPLTVLLQLIIYFTVFKDITMFQPPTLSLLLVSVGCIIMSLLIAELSYHLIKKDHVIERIRNVDF